MADHLSDPGANEYEEYDAPPPYTPPYNLRLVLHQDATEPPVENLSAQGVAPDTEQAETRAAAGPEEGANIRADRNDQSTFAELSGLWTEIFKELGNAWSEVSSGLGKGMVELKNDLLNARVDVSNGLNDAKLGVSQAVNETRDGLSKAMGDAKDELSRAMNEARSELSKAMSSTLGPASASGVPPHSPSKGPATALEDSKE
ncbi:hypothetical protein CLIB1423_18S01640 [[Candida] railenensis]|uniref:Uncharacterized protein n=1 Tax=[Candida] railenensis TaxID=45579 RepID=A0A9P0QUA0_9ASCO|nr:hypothetical protein CLIB1423_18S01640 [[Candida] railenensis]